MKWPRASIPVFGSCIQGPCARSLEWEGKGNDNNIELRLALTLCNLDLGEESSSNFISVNVPHLTHW